MNELPAGPQTVLRHPPFLFFWGSRTGSNIAWQIQAVAVGWQIYALTGQALDLGLVGLMEFLPLIAFMLVVGPVADRFDRRRIVQAGQLLEACAAAVLAYAAYTETSSKELILITVFLLGTGRAFEAPTTNTILPAIVPPALFPKAVATSSSATQVATIAGPAIGGLLYALSPTLVYVVCCLAFIVAALCMGAIRTPPRQVVRMPVTLETVFAGIRYIRNNKIVLGAMSLDLFAVLLGGAVALLPIYASDIFQVGPVGLGLLRAAPAVGALTMLAILSRWSIQRNVGKVLFSAVAVFGVATIVFGVSTSFVLSLAALVVLGASDSLSVVVRQTLVQLETTDDMRGRVSAVGSLFVGTSNALGAFESGAVAAWLGAVPAVVLGGVGTLVVAGLWMKLFPDLLQMSTMPPLRMQAPPTSEPAKPA